MLVMCSGFCLQSTSSRTRRSLAFAFPNSMRRLPGSTRVQEQFERKSSQAFSSKSSEIHRKSMKSLNCDILHLSGFHWFITCNVCSISRTPKALRHLAGKRLCYVFWAWRDALWCDPCALDVFPHIAGMVPSIGWWTRHFVLGLGNETEIFRFVKLIEHMLQTFAKPINLHMKFDMLHTDLPCLALGRHHPKSKLP